MNPCYSLRRRAGLAIAVGDAALEVIEIARDAPPDLARQHISNDPPFGCPRAAGRSFRTAFLQTLVCSGSFDEANLTWLLRNSQRPPVFRERR